MFLDGRPPAAPTVAVDSTSTAKGGERRQEVTIRAAVQKIDLKSRKVTLKGYDGPPRPSRSPTKCETSTR